MSDQPDRIRAWNEDTGRMTGPWTIEETICKIAPILAPTNGEPDSDPLGHLVFMRNTGIYAKPRKELAHSSHEELFDGDLILQSVVPFLYRVTQEHGCWMAVSLCPADARSRLLNSVYMPILVGNVFENNELMTSGEVI